MGKFRPLPEPIRLQDLLNSARSRTEKKIKCGKEQVDRPMNKTAARRNPEERVCPAFAKRRSLEVRVLQIYQI